MFGMEPLSFLPPKAWLRWVTPTGLFRATLRRIVAVRRYHQSSWVGGRSRSTAVLTITPRSGGNSLLVGHGLRKGRLEQVSRDVVDGRHRDTQSNLPTVRPYMKTAGHALVRQARFARGRRAYKPSKTAVRWWCR